MQPTNVYTEIGRMYRPIICLHDDNNYSPEFS